MTQFYAFANVQLGIVALGPKSSFKADGSMQVRKRPLHIRILRDEFERRQAKNPRYSLRAFAIALDVHASLLSRVFNGKQDLSIQSCVAIVSKLKLSYSEARLFIASVADYQRDQATELLSRAIDPDLLESSTLEIDRDLLQGSPSSSRNPLTALRLTSDLVSMMDLEGRFIFANEVATAVLMEERCELIGERWAQTRLDPETAALFEKQQLTVVRERRERSFYFTQTNESGERHFVRTVTPVINTDGQMHAYVSSIRDVTENTFLINLVTAMHAAHGASEIASTLAKGCVPELANSVVVQLGRGDAKLSVVAAIHTSEQAPGEFFGRVDSSALAELSTHVFAHSKNETIEISDPSLGARLGFGEQEGPRFAVVAPLGELSDSFGRLTLLRSEPFSDAAIRVVGQLAINAGYALRNARS